MLDTTNVTMDKTVQVCVTLPKRVLEKLDAERGLIPRSRYIAYKLTLYESPKKSD